MGEGEGEGEGSGRGRGGRGEGKGEGSGRGRGGRAEGGKCLQCSAVGYLENNRGFITSRRFDSSCNLWCDTVSEHSRAHSGATFLRRNTSRTHFW